TPKTILKPVKNTLEITKRATEKLDVKDIPAELEKLKALMTLASKSLDFETAIKLRDKISALKKLQGKFK
ncbi:MAG: UvrB/UvrC motif-containing protein, partial [Clostridiales bacterium]|nr:UvrB/UvrC motif-containing protein [Clostridiales bacterium]